MKLILWGVIVSMCTALCLAQAPKSSKPLASAQLDAPGIVAEVIESTRRDGVLTIRVRFRNTGDKAASLNLASAGHYDENYVTAAETKYTVVRDSKGYAVATPMDPGGDLTARIAKGGTWNWWAKFSAPPEDVKTYALYLKVGPPIEDIPIVEKQPGRD